MAEKVKDVIDWRGKRAKIIANTLKKLDFNIAILSDNQYVLDHFEIIRLVNIIYTSKRIKRSLEAFVEMRKRRNNIYENQLEIIRNAKKKKKQIRATIREEF